MACNVSYNYWPQYIHTPLTNQQNFASCVYVNLYEKQLYRSCLRGPYACSAWDIEMLFADYNSPNSRDKAFLKEL